MDKKILILFVKNNFSNYEQQLFVASFYCYLNYDFKNDFVIDLDNVWKWLGFSQKDSAKRVLEKNFIVENNYKILLHNSAEQKIFFILFYFIEKTKYKDNMINNTFIIKYII